MADSRTNPMNPNQICDDSASGEIAGETEPLKMTEGDTPPPSGALDYAFPETSPTEDPRSDPALDRDPGQVAGSRDPDVANSVERDGRPESQRGDTPYDAQGAMGSEGD